MTVTVRPATRADVPWLLDRLQAFDRFFGSSRSLFPDLDTAESILTSLITDHPFFVADVERNGAVEPIGFVAGALVRHPYNPAIRVLSEMFWWVEPPYRHSRAALVLLNALIAAGRERADWIVVSLQAETAIHPETLERRGFRLKETSYLLEVA